MTWRQILIAAVTAAVAGLALPGIGQARTCEGVGGTAEEGGQEYEWGAFDVRARGVSCAKARRHIRTCAETRKAPPGWRFRMADHLPSLRRGDKRITWQAAGGGGTCPGAAPAWRQCGSIAFTPNSDDGVANIRARRTGCKRARRVARGAEATSVVDGPFEYRKAAFTCRGRPRDEGLPVVQWKCERRKARIRFVRS